MTVQRGRGRGRAHRLRRRLEPDHPQGGRRRPGPGHRLRHLRSGHDAPRGQGGQGAQPGLFVIVRTRYASETDELARARAPGTSSRRSSRPRSRSSPASWRSTTSRATSSKPRSRSCAASATACCGARAARSGP
ncbi:MAG: hypothetical protein M0C28_38980 [Candidatus Moduliflexus flocculans]|nr:hypothetical protein [Candidatus Moduliflexus flocculans]